MELIRPSKEYEKSWMEALRQFESENVTGFWNYPAKPTDLESYIRLDLDNSIGLNLVQGWVPSTTFWLVDKGKFIGHVNIRHRLNDKLREHGGHIGYAIRRDERQKGYGTKILELALPIAMEIGISVVSIMCEDSNFGSAKIIEKNGGVLSEVAEFEGRRIRKYTIDLRGSSGRA